MQHFPRNLIAEGSAKRNENEFLNLRAESLKKLRTDLVVAMEDSDQGEANRIKRRIEAIESAEGVI
jgi:hypothetical protein